MLRWMFPTLLIPLLVVHGCTRKASEPATDGKPAAQSSDKGERPQKTGGKGGESAGTEERGGRGKGGEGRARGPATVRTTKAERRELPRVARVVTVLSGQTQADVFAKVTGRVAFIGPKEGDRVEAGTLLFRVDRNDPGESFLNVPVVSPIAGWVGRWFVSSPGEQVTPQDAVVTIVNDSVLRSTVFLPFNDWTAVRKDTAVSVTVAGVKRSGRIASIARAAEASSGRGSITIEVDNADHAWRSGMVAQIILDLEIKPRMVLTATALSMTDQGAFVFEAKEDKAIRRQVSFKIVDADTVEILSGLDAGALVITAGNNLVSDGAPIQIVDEGEGSKR
jgi:multidrug efflux pump subunit AcrA (membrane-fusion protein)